MAWSLDGLRGARGDPRPPHQPADRRDPPELGNLANLWWLGLYSNQLTGEIPAELGDLASLKLLGLSDNVGLTGALPLALSSLSLREFGYHGTGLCVPADESFRAWLSSIASHCGTGARAVRTRSRAGPILMPIRHASHSAQEE